MTRKVPDHAVSVPFSRIGNGRPVTADVFRPSAQLANYIRARGRVIVPTYSAMVDLRADGSTYTFRFRGPTTGLAWQRRWHVLARETSGETDDADIGKFTLSTNVVTSGTDFYANTGNNNGSTPAVWTETFASQQTGGIRDWNLEIEMPSLDTGEIATGRGEIQVLAIGCQELPRAILESGSPDNGIDVDSFAPGAPIFADRFGDLADAINDPVHGSRCLFQWSVPDTEDFAISTSSAFSDVFKIPVPALTRRLSNAANRSVSFAFYGWNSDSSTTGRVRIDSSKRAPSSSVSISSTTKAWSANGSVNIDTEDLSEPDGQRGGADDLLDVEFRRISGSGTSYLSAIAVFEDD